MKPTHGHSYSITGMADKGVCWSITINNPTAADLEQWKQITSLHWVKEAKGQLERGAEGTEHIQGMLRTLSVRFSQVKKALPRAHIEKARSEAALRKYVQKSDTKIAPIEVSKVATTADVHRWMAHHFVKYWWRKRFDFGEDKFDDIATSYYCAAQWLQCNPDCILGVEGLMILDDLKIFESLFDAAIKSVIMQGYLSAETLGTNPMVRTSCIKYFIAIMYRYFKYGDDEVAYWEGSSRGLCLFVRKADCPQDNEAPAVEAGGEGGGEGSEEGTESQH